MNCPSCRQRTEVIKTELGQGGQKLRLRRCPQHGRFWTKSVEKVVEWIDIKSLPATAKAVAQPLPLSAIPVGATHISAPDHGLSGLPSKPLSQSQTRVDPPAAFMAEWEMTAKTGSRKEALKAWEKLGRPAFGLSWRAWEVSAQWAPSWFNYPHVSSWLNDGRWEQDPSEARVRSNTPALPQKVQDSRAVAIAWAHKETA